MTDSGVWSVCPGALEWREWDSGCAIFNRRSGETHFLDLTSSYILRLIEQSPGTPDEIAARMARELELEDAPERRTQILRTLNNFDAMGVIVPWTEGPA